MLKQAPLLLAFLLFHTIGRAQQPAFYHYETDLRAVNQDRVQVQLHLNATPDSTAVFCFPKMVPGIYGVMDFGQFIESLNAVDSLGNTLEIVRLDTNRWEIKNAHLLHHLNYEVNDGWEEFSMKTERDEFYRSASCTFHDRALVINNNCLFGYFEGKEKEPIELRIHKPTKYYGASSLKNHAESDSLDRFWASDYHYLVDNPILYSQPDTSHIHLPNIEVLVACYSTTGQKISKDVSEHIAQLLENQRSYLGGELPVDHYTFLLYHNPSPSRYSYMGDGLEHAHSTLILLCVPWDKDLIVNNVYGIASHEFFHTVMPLGLHSFEIEEYNFSQPVLSRHLWLYEGMTEYFSVHMPMKNGLQTEADFLKELERKIRDSKQFDNSLSLTDLSVHAMERQDQYYNFYLKGTLVCLCLDIHLRELSDGKYGVQELIQDLLAAYGPDKPFEDAQLFSEIARISGYPEVKDFLEDYIANGKPLPLESYLLKVGYELGANQVKIRPIDELSPEQAQLRKHWIAH
jgi:predicted metalloprotease with PDZ domain